MRRHLARLLVRTALLASLPVAAHAGVAVPTGFVNEVVVGSLSEPNSMAFLPDWRILVTEQRTGRIRLIVNNMISTMDPVHTIQDVNGSGYEQGLQGIAVDPAWPQRPYVYVYYDRDGGFCRLVRYTVSGDIDDPLGHELTFGNPVILIDDIPDLFITHNGGCVRFGGDGHLYVSTGDDDHPCTAADSSSMLGAILRLRVHNLEENVASPVARELITPYDNPLSTPDPDARLVWAWGMRNPWRFHIDPLTGRIYVADVGLVTYEELDEILPGDFLGWPYREGPQVMNRPQCPEPGGAGSNYYKSATVNMLRNPSDLVSISSAGVYRPILGASNNWPSEYHGDLFYGEYYSGRLHRLNNFKGTWVPADSAPGQPSAATWATGLASAVDFAVGPDGSLYYLSQYDSTLTGPTGRIQRVKYPGASGPVSVDPVLAQQIYFTTAPNPFAGKTTLAFRLPLGASARLDLYDLQGRRVRRLMDGRGVAGENRVTWDGADGHGRTVEPGVYLARLEFLGYAKTIRLVRVR